MHQPESEEEGEEGEEENSERQAQAQPDFFKTLGSWATSAAATAMSSSSKPTAAPMTTSSSSSASSTAAAATTATAALSSLGTWAKGLGSELKRHTEAVASTLDKDMKEFVTVVGTDASAAASKLQNTLRQTSLIVAGGGEGGGETAAESSSSNISATFHPPASSFSASSSRAAIVADASAKLVGQSTVLMGKLGLGLATFKDSLVARMAPLLNDSSPSTSSDDTDSASTTTSSSAYDKRAAMISSLRLDPSTYLTDPLFSEDASVRQRYSELVNTFRLDHDKIRRIFKEDPSVEILIRKLGRERGRTRCDLFPVKNIHPRFSPCSTH